MRISLSSLLVLAPALALPTDGPGGDPNKPLVRLLYEYPEGTWLENLAVRASGELLITQIGKAQLDQFNPFAPNAEPKVVHTFPNSLALTGIAEIAPDSFAVAVGNLTFTSGGQRGSWEIWNIAFENPSATDIAVDEIASIHDIILANGMCSIPSSNVPLNVLYGDITSGVIWYLNTTTGKPRAVINNTLTAAIEDPLFGASGVNGMHVKNGILYLVNTAKKIFASMPIHSDGTAAGEATVIAHSHKPEEVFYFDDFAIKDNDAYVVTGAGNSIERIGLDGTPKGRIIAGNLNSTQFAGPTSAAFGRTKWDSDLLYVVTSGALVAPVDGNITTGGQILAVDTSRWTC